MVGDQANPDDKKLPLEQGEADPDEKKGNQANPEDKKQANPEENKLEWKQGDAILNVNPQQLRIQSDLLDSIDPKESFTWTLHVGNGKTRQVRIYGKPLMRVWNMWLGNEIIPAIMFWDGKYQQCDSFREGVGHINDDIGSFSTAQENQGYTLILSAFK